MPSKPTKKSSKPRQNAQKAPDKKKGGLSTPAKVLIVVFAVLMALSLMLPSLAAVFNVATGNTQGDQTITAEDLVNAVNEQYSSQVEDLQSQLADDPDNDDLRKQLADAEMGWAAALSYYGTTDQETLDAYDHAKAARDDYDAYLKDNPDDDEVLTSRAMSSYYAGDTDEAVSELEQITSSSPDYAPAWANLGMLYEVKGETEKATEAYQTAVEKDPDDEAGAKSYAQGRLDSILGTDSSTSGDASASGVSASDASGSAQ